MPKINMKNILTLLLFACLAFSCLQKVSKQDGSSEFAASEEFVQGSEDIPLLRGMEKMPDESLGFDSNSGSVISSSYKSEVELKKVKNFYLKTLPRMGWNTTSDSNNCIEFTRENEKLEIEFEEQDDVNMVKFFISSGI
jgi:hypothetical protein